MSDKFNNTETEINNPNKTIDIIIKTVSSSPLTEFELNSSNVSLGSFLFQFSQFYVIFFEFLEHLIYIFNRILINI